METGAIELNVEPDRWARRQKREKKKTRLRRRRRRRWPSLERTFAWRRDAGSPTLSSRVFAPENSRSSYVTGSRGRSYGEVTMREDGCRLSDATLDKYLRRAPLPPSPGAIRPAPPIRYRLVSFAVRLREPWLERCCSHELSRAHSGFHGIEIPLEKRGGEKRERGREGEFYVIPFTFSFPFLPCADGENAQLQQCSCVCVSLSLRFRVR